MKTLLACSLLLALAACDTSAPTTDPFGDAFSGTLERALAEVPNFGGLGVETNAPANTSGFVVFTLGDDPAVAAELRSRFEGLFTQPDTLYIRARPATGQGSDALASRVAGAVSHSVRVEHDDATGYVRAGFRNEFTARRAIGDMRVVGIALDHVLVQVEGHLPKTGQ